MLGVFNGVQWAEVKTLATVGRTRKKKGGHHLQRVVDVWEGCVPSLGVESVLAGFRKID